MRQSEINLLIKQWVIIPLILVFLWLILTGIYIINSEENPTILPIYHPVTSFQNFKQLRLMKSYQLTGVIRAEENNLGIISIRFSQTNEPIVDKVIFRIRQKGAPKWYYERVYDARQFYFLPLYTFGFPIIDNSKNLLYEFEIESLKGTYSNSVQVSTEEPVIVSKYKYNKHLLLTDPSILYHFLVRKSLTIISSSDFKYKSFLFLLPLILYVLWQGYIRNHIPKIVTDYLKKTKTTKYVVPKITSLIVAADIIFIRHVQNPVIVFVIFLMIFGLIKYRTEVRASFLLSLIFLWLSLLFSMIGLVEYADKSAVWAYVFLVFGILQSLISVSFLNLLRKKSGR